MHSLDPESRSPLYLQLYAILSEKIQAKEYPAGTFLPSEKELAQEYGVSRITVRNALKLLKQRNLIEKKKGAGSFVKPQLIDQPLSTVIYFDQDVKRFGHEPSSTVLRNAITYADTHIACSMGIEENTKMICVVRLRFADSEPLCLEMAYLLYDRCPGVLGRDFSSSSLRRYLENEYGIIWTTASQKIYASPASPEIAPLLNLKRNDPVLYIERVSLCQNGLPGEYLAAYYRGDRYYLTANLAYK